MRKLAISEFITLDGVMEAPGGEESSALGARVGWTMRFFNDEVGRLKFDEVMGSDALLLGRKTYEGFAAAWPERAGDGGFADKFNSMPKYVVSTTLDKADWNNSTLIKGDLAQQINALKQQPGQEIMVNGSCALARSLIELGLVDEYRLMVFPVIVGGGKRLFPDQGALADLRLVSSQPTSTGVIFLTYQPAAAATPGA